jgi:predicted nucleic acid-binding protein
MPVLSAVLDTCVLFPSRLRDILLDTVYYAGLYECSWSDESLDELRRNLVTEGRHPVERVDRLIGALKATFKYATIPASQYEPFMALATNDKKDRHVLATALAVRASVIVTSNLKDFLASVLSPLGVAAQSPDEFLSELLVAAPEAMARVITRPAARYRAPAMSTTELLEKLARHTPHFSSTMAALLDSAST